MYELKDKTIIETKKTKSYDTSNLSEDEYSALCTGKITIEELIKKGKINAI